MITTETTPRTRPRASGPALLALVLAFPACSGGDAPEALTRASQSCMGCHNGSGHDDYSGPGITNPHPFAPADNLTCTTCHGGNAAGTDKETSHVPPPPEIGDRENQKRNAEAWFNKLTLAGMDRYPDYVAAGRTWSALDYLQFVNPGDLRVVTKSKACGACHQGHAECVARSPLATSTGILGGSMYAIGADVEVPASATLHRGTASDLAFRTITDPTWSTLDPLGTVPELLEQPVYSTRGETGPDKLFRNQTYSSPTLPGFVRSDGRIVSDSPLEHLFREQVSFTCGDCHLGSSGQNNRAGDFRSSGCTACHMPYSLGGKSGSGDPNVAKDEPVNPDAIDEPERAHVRAHRIASTHKTLPNGSQNTGIGDLTCAGCHQGSNRMVMQYWGIRLDQNQDLRRGVQYPANPVSWRNTAADTRLFDPAVGNRTFNGRNANQYIEFEDYDGDHRDDTPPDVHHAAGLGCIDCHGSADLHGDVAGARKGQIVSRMEQAVAIRCENCHGTPTAYAASQVGTAHDGVQRDLAVDGRGTVLKHVVKEGEGTFFLTGKLDGKRHYIRQVKDVIVDSGKLHPITGAPIYSARASYAMGRADGDASNGIGPHQSHGVTPGFAHTDTMSCASCHSSWTNSCIGCHLGGEYSEGNNFSNITGKRIVYRQEIADFVYQSVVPFQLGVGMNGKIEQVASNTKVFYQYKDLNGVRSQVFAFSDREGRGAGTAVPFPSLGHNFMLAHSIRGKVTATDEGPRYCVACHLTTKGLADYRTIYDSFRATMANDDFANLDFAMLKEHIGRNPGNQKNSPIWVHMVAGLGSGLFLFDSSGRPMNPLDGDANRRPFNVAPNTRFDAGLVRFNLDKIVLSSGVTTASSNHVYLTPPATALRDGATDPEFTGPLGATLIRRLTDPDVGIVLDSWLDADGAVQGNAGTWIR